MEPKPSIAKSLAPIYQPGHPQTIAVYQTLAEGFNVVVSDEHREYWRTMLTVARALDNYLDTAQPDSIDDLYGHLLSGEPIIGVDENSARSFRDIAFSVTPERLGGILTGLNYDYYAKEMRFTRGYNRYVELRTEEAEIFGKVMGLDNPDSLSEIAEFNDWLPRFSRAGYLLDSVGDLGIDYRDEVMHLRPTIKRRTRLAQLALHETLDAIKPLPPGTIGRLALAGSSKLLRGFINKLAPDPTHYRHNNN